MKEVVDNFRGNRSIDVGTPYFLPSQIAEAVAVNYGVTVEDMKSIRRKRKICFPRQVSMYLMLNHTRMSLEQIGEFFGFRDHTTVCHARNVVKDLMDSYVDVKEEINSIIKKTHNMNVYVQDIDNPKSELAEAVYLLRFLRLATKSWNSRPGFTTMQEMREWEEKADEFLKKVSTPV